MPPSSSCHSTWLTEESAGAGCGFSSCVSARSVLMGRRGVAVEGRPGLYVREGEGTNVLPQGGVGTDSLTG